MHLMGCFWYFVATIDERPENWINRDGYKCNNKYNNIFLGIMNLSRITCICCPCTSLLPRFPLSVTGTSRARLSTRNSSLFFICFSGWLSILTSSVFRIIQVCWPVLCNSSLFRRPVSRKIRKLWTNCATRWISQPLSKRKWSSF